MSFAEFFMHPILWPGACLLVLLVGAVIIDLWG